MLLCMPVMVRDFYGLSRHRETNLYSVCVQTGATCEHKQIFGGTKSIILVSWIDNSIDLIRIELLVSSITKISKRELNPFQLQRRQEELV